MTDSSSALADSIRREIQVAGPLSFARFMELALYHPDYGYYRRLPKQIGCQGDFFTSVSAGPLLGKLLAFHFAGCLADLTAPTLARGTHAEGTSVPLLLVEAGAHQGQLCLDILHWFEEQRPALFSSIEYWILEPSPELRCAQEATLKTYAAKIHWFHSWESIVPGAISGIIFANELLDAFPVVRLGWDAAGKRWFEWRVAWAPPRFVWQRGDLSAAACDELNRPFWRTLPAELLDLLPDGFTLDLCPSVRQWWLQAARRLGRGQLVTLDYGLKAEEFLAPQRKNGTLRAFHAHHATLDVLAQPGAQDLTAHVNFSDLLEAGAQSGLTTEFFGSQSEFLTQIVKEVSRDFSRFGAWTPAEHRQFQTLTHPEHLGRAFRVLVQGKAYSDTRRF
jgi:SAM-dependent MidA family methyltransferase